MVRRYNLIPQEKDNYCLCSVLQAIFSNDDVEITQEEIASNLNPSKKGFYFDDSRFKDFLFGKGYNFNFFRYDETPFNEPEEILREERDIFLSWNNHVVLLDKFEDPMVNYIDPVEGKIISRDLGSLLREMGLNKSGFFGVISKI